ncbi:MAG: primosomal protein N' [Anaerolineales bacterium]|nr:primosomal protein N' [Anaerolineales bacterium]
MTYLQIAVHVPQVTGTFDYHLPPALEGQVQPGCLVTVPFGQQTVQGIVIGEVEVPAVADTRPVESLLDPVPAVTPAQIALAQHLAEATLAPLAACLALMLPPGLAQLSDTLYTPQTSEVLRDFGSLTDAQKKIVQILQERGPLRGRQLDRALPRTHWRTSMLGLTRRGVVAAQSVLPAPTVRPRHVRTAQLAVPSEAVETAELGNTDATRTRRLAILRALIREGSPVDVPWLYAESGGKQADLEALADRGLILLGESEMHRDPLGEVEWAYDRVPALTPDQLAVWREIKAGIDATARGEWRNEVPLRPFLLHGVTGSGKTEIYLRAMAEMVRLGKSVIYLVPEIALTPQTVRRIMGRFPGRVGLVHSELSAGERYDTWRRARDGQVTIIVGPRSALFTPLRNLGLIVVDEFHDHSYYQSESAPFYHAREAAVAYARLAGAVAVLGSATPDVGSMYRAERGEWNLLKLPARILAHKEAVEKHLKNLQTLKVSGEFVGAKAQGEMGGKVIGGGARKPLGFGYKPYSEDAMTAELPFVRLVDMRQELKAGNRSVFSRVLQERLGMVLEAGQQAILFLNRRGSATYVFCRDCGFVLKCPKCQEAPLTYHREGGGRETSGTLICHHCGYTRQQPKKCPECGGTRIRYYGMGTEQVEEEVQALFPAARTLRWDQDTTKQKGSHEIILRHFMNHQADVLIGTQMLAKGLDLPLVTLVGIVLADVGLHLPDFHAGERAFQTLSQVAGRAGRSPLGGEVVLQTFHPSHYVIRAVTQHDYAGFYAQELKYRRDLGYTPFGQVVRLEFRHPDAVRAEGVARALGEKIQGWLREDDRRETDLIGPVPSFFGRVGGDFRWQIILRGPNPASLLVGRKLTDWKVEVEPQSLL